MLIGNYILSPIPGPSIWEGSHTPDLNGQRLFLRGGNDNEALAFEDDAFQGISFLRY